MPDRSLPTYRWLSLLAFGLAAFAPTLTPGPLPETASAFGIMLVFATIIGSNVWVSLQTDLLSPRMQGALLALDTLLFTYLLHQCGGAMNPFSLYYLVYVVVAALLVDLPTTALVSLLSTCGFASLLVRDEHSGHHHMRDHLVGMWVAYGLSALVVTGFVAREAVRRKRREQAMQRLQESQRKMERLAQITTLAAGAAHELASPLSTITLIAEAVLRHAQRPGDEHQELAEDGKLMAAELLRCQAILTRLRAEPAGELARAVTLEYIEQELSQALAPRQAVLRCSSSGSFFAPPIGLAQALVNLSRNAFDAGSESVELELDPAHNTIAVRDRGHGLSAQDLQHLGEPFYTSKGQGRGLGLGVFLAKTLVEQCGGTLTFNNREGGGAVFTLQLPRQIGQP